MPHKKSEARCRKLCSCDDVHSEKEELLSDLVLDVLRRLKIDLTALATAGIVQSLHTGPLLQLQLRNLCRGHALGRSLEKGMKHDGKEEGCGHARKDLCARLGLRSRQLSIPLGRHPPLDIPREPE